MTDKLPPNLLALFQPRPALRYLPPADHAPGDRRTKAIDGSAAFVEALKEKQEQEKDDAGTESWLQRKDREALEKRERHAKLIDEDYKNNYKPHEDSNIRGDAYKTLFISRLSYDATTKDLEREFSRFGAIERVRIVTDRGKGKKSGKPRGYAFVLFENEFDMKAAYKESENLVINNRKVIVDVERGRTVKDWRPRRFGGGQGGRHYTKAPAKSMGYGPPSGPGFRGGGFRGGFDRGAPFRGGRGGGFRNGSGGFGGGRGGGFQNGPPDGAPAGPRSGGAGGSGRSGYGGGSDERPRNNANFEPLPPRGGGGGGGGYRDRDRDQNERYERRDRDRDGYSSGQKRPYEGSGGYDDSRSRRRY